MDPSYIYFKEIKIDQDNTFTANFSEENEIENVKFNKENEYGITGLTINADLPDKKILKIENEKEQDKISREIQELIKQNKEPNLTFIISHPETKSIEIPFVKKKWNRTTEEKTDFFNTITKKNEDFTFYDYVGHLEKFGYEWNKEGFKYKIKIENNKKIKKFTLERQKRIDFNVDSSRIFNTQPNASSGVISFSMGYLENITLLKNYYKISGKIFDFTSLPISKKHEWFGDYSICWNHRSLPYKRGFDDLYSTYFRPFTVILKDSNLLLKKFNNRIQKLFVPRLQKTNKFSERHEICRWISKN